MAISMTKLSSADYYLDRTREALFSALASWFDTADEAPERQLDGVAVLDLYAGSGAVGLEAASRGAHPVVLVESDAPTARLISANARGLRLRAEVRAARAEAASTTSPLATRGGRPGRFATARMARQSACPV